MRYLALLATLLLAGPALAQGHPAGQGHPAVIRWLGRHKNALLANAMLIAATAADIHSTEAVFRRCPTCTEGTPHLFGGKRPGAGALWGNDLLIGVLPSLAYSFYAESQGEHGLAWAIPSVWTAYHFYGVVHNAGIPASCPGTGGPPPCR